MITTWLQRAMGWAALAGWGAGCAGDTGSRIEASGTVEATEADLGFQTAGRIDSIFVAEGERLEAGQRIAVLDRRELIARRHAAEAQVAAQRARLTELEHGFRPEEVEQARAALRAMERRVTDADRDLTRARNLFAGGAISRQALDQHETALEITQAERDRAQEQARLLERGPRIEQIAAQGAALNQAEAALAQVDAALAFAEVTAPSPATVTLRHREPGEVVAAGLPVVRVANLEDRWVRIYVREDALGQVRLGGSATIRIDGFPERTYRGEVTYIADEAEFTPRNVQTREDRVRLVYRVKVRIVGDSAVDLKPGLPADVELQIP
jgi:HlyD family secretion protein